MGDCSKCYPSARCCNYVSAQIDTPRSKGDFDDLLWHVAHNNVSIYVESREWFLSFQTRCGFLGKENRCKIYETRPQICREYENVDCAYDYEYDFDLEFQTYDELKEYVEIRFSKNGYKKVREMKSRWKPKTWKPPKHYGKFENFKEGSRP